MGEKEAAQPRTPGSEQGAVQAEPTDHDWFDHVDVIAHGRSGAINSFESGEPLAPVPQQPEPVNEMQLEPPSGARISTPVLLMVSLLATAAILIIGFAIIANGDGNQSEDDAAQSPDQQNESAGSETPPLLGSLASPYPFGQPVSLSYFDAETGDRAAWQIDVLESASSPGDGIDLRPAVGEIRLASVQVVLTYQSADAAGQREDLRFEAVDQSGSPFIESQDGCGPNEVLPASGDELLITDRMEGWLCWWVPQQSLEELLLSVEATPADGVLYMSLDPN